MARFTSLNEGPVVVVGTATDGPYEPQLVSNDPTSSNYYMDVYGRIPIDPSNIFDNSDQALFDRNLTKTIAEVYAYGGEDLSIVGVRVGVPKKATLDLFEDQIITNTDYPTDDEGNPSTSIRISSRYNGDEYNYFTINVDTDGNGNNYIDLQYTPPDGLDELQSVNLIDDPDIYERYVVSFYKRTLESVVRSINTSVFGRYLEASINYLEHTETFSVNTNNRYLSFDSSEPYAYDLHKINYVRVISDLSEVIDSGYSDFKLKMDPDKSLDLSDKTIEKAYVINNVITLNPSDFIIDNSTGLYYYKVPTGENYSNENIVITSIEDESENQINISIKKNKVIVTKNELDYVGGIITVKYKYPVNLAEAKYSHDRINGVWYLYYVSGDRIEFGDQLPYSLEVYYTSSQLLTQDVDYYVDSFGRTSVSGVDQQIDGSPISIDINYNSDILKSVTNGTIEIKYDYYPEFPATTGTTSGSKVQLDTTSGGTDGSQIDDYKYRNQIMIALSRAKNIGPSDIIVCGIYYDSYISKYTADISGYVFEDKNWIDFITELSNWAVVQSTNVDDCRIYIPGRGVNYNYYESERSSINKFLRKHISAGYERPLNPVEIRKRFNNFRLRFVVGDAESLVPAVSDTYFRTNLAVVSLIMTRTRANIRSKIGTKLKNTGDSVSIRSKLIVSDVNMRDSINESGWEFYSGVPETDYNIGIVCISEKTGATVGTILDSQFASDSLYLALKTAKEEIKKYLGRPATVQTLNQIKQETDHAIMSAYYPDLLLGGKVEFEARTREDVINERSRFTISIRLNGFDDTIVFEDTVGA